VGVFPSREDAKKDRPAQLGVERSAFGGWPGLLGKPLRSSKGADTTTRQKNVRVENEKAELRLGLRSLRLTEKSGGPPVQLMPAIERA